MSVEFSKRKRKNSFGYYTQRYEVEDADVDAILKDLTSLKASLKRKVKEYKLLYTSLKYERNEVYNKYSELQQEFYKKNYDEDKEAYKKWKEEFDTTEDKYNELEGKMNALDNTIEALEDILDKLEIK